MRPMSAMRVGAVLVALGSLCGLPAEERILSMEEARGILGDALPYHVAQAGRILEARRASPEMGGGGSVSSLVTIQVGNQEADGLNVILWAWDLTLEPDEFDLITFYTDGEPLTTIVNGEPYQVASINASALISVTDQTGPQIRKVVGENLDTAKLTESEDSLEVLPRPPFSDPTISPCGPGPRDPSTGKCSLAIEWTNPTPPAWYSFFLEEELLIEEDEPLKDYILWLGPGKGVFAKEAHGDQALHVIPGFAPGKACVYMVGSRSEGGNDYLGHMVEVCCDLSCPDRGCDGPFVRRFAASGKGALESKQDFLISFLPGESVYTAIHVKLDGVELPPLPGNANEIYLSGIEPGVHEVVLEGECGDGGISSPSRYQFYVVPEGIEATPPSEVKSKFLDEDYTRITVTWKNAAEPLVHEVFLLDEEGRYQHAITVSGRSSGANIEVTREGHRVAVLSFFQAGTFAYFSEPIVSEPAPPPLTRFLRGDCDANDNLDLTDAIFTLDLLFQGGEESSCNLGCDSNFDGRQDLADAVFTLNFLFLGGPPPEGNYPQCDEVPEELRPICPRSTCRR